ncbi:hypothetical protein D1614_15535 [Maribellus luteus]|uniref:Gliding motility-associated C-terminal domain-containing protein n=1 Tax=Maribellus luteus TaxID=2305463 RepID=A0A399SWR8_9BACT|nr:gliding motility-associated C-terminal domain-containing protein [Maribellus luteus]RIJ47169.1 hypothetical protein D1614_15535 [Maribellus luteus]
MIRNPKIISQNNFSTKGLVFLLICIVFFGSEAVFATDLNVTKTSLKISNDAGVAINGSLKINSNVLFNNSGNIYCTSGGTLELNSSIQGSGNFYLYGDEDYSVSGSSALVSNLYLSRKGTTYINSRFLVSNSLHLTSGLIDVLPGSELYVENLSADAISCSDDLNSESYVIGTISRNVNPFDTYFFPVGDNNGIRSFYIESCSSLDKISVSYLPDIETTWNAAQTEVSLTLPGGWQVDTENATTAFIPGMSLFGVDESEKYSLSVLNISDLEVLPPKFVMDFNSVLTRDMLYLSTNTPNNSGLLALGQLGKITNPGIENEGPKLVNFLVVNGTARSTFEVPGINNYKQITLKVFSRHGNLVYESGNYKNDFDAINYKEGTYFYEMNLENLEGEKILMRNIIEIVGRN